MGQRSAVVIYFGSSSPRPERSVGPFDSVELAEAWCEKEGLGQTPAEGEWAVIVPLGEPRS